MDTHARRNGMPPLPTRHRSATVERVQTLAEFAQLRREWNRLLENSPADCLFLTWEWLYAWWKHLRGGWRLFLLLVRVQGELVAIAPFALRARELTRLVPFRALEFLGTRVIGSDYMDVIIGRGKEDVALDVLADYLTRENLILDLAPVQHRSSAVAALAQRLQGRGWAASETTINVCPFISLSGNSWPSYLAGLSPAHRYNFHRRLRNITGRFDARLELVRTETQRLAGLQALVGLHARRWQARGGSAAFGSQALLSFYDEVSRFALDRGWLRLFVLRLNGAPAAVLHGYRYGARFYFYQSAFDPTFAKLSVGFVTMGLVIRQALEEGAAEYDLLHGAEPYKFHWTRRTRKLDRLELFPPTLRGAVFRRLASRTRRVRGRVRRLIGDALADRIAYRGWIGPRDPVPARVGKP